MAERITTWEGGYIRKDGRGRNVYVIRQQINGKRYEKSTRAFRARAAIEQLKRFHEDPEGYDPRGDVEPDPIYLDEELVDEFLRWSRVTKQNSVKWVAEQKLHLGWWADRLHGVDLRRCDLDEHIRPPLKNAPGRSHKAAVLKSFYAWLRTEREGGPEKRVKLAQDPTAGGMLPVPAAKPANMLKALPRKTVLSCRDSMGPPYRDALELQAETGWHVTEVQRFCESGEIEDPTDEQRAKGVAGVLIVKHKGGQDHRTGVSAETLAAAQRLQRMHEFSTSAYAKAVRKACRAAGVKPFGPGQLRHSVATWMVNAGVPIPVVSTFLGHKSTQTTKKFYARFVVPENPLLRPVK